MLAKLVERNGKKCFECYDIVKNNMLFFGNLSGVFSKPYRESDLVYYNGFSPLL